ncbi:hypothetical protein [Streptomyces sp. NPDC087307]|uniref:hypothetical protein n=3 Tax=unclassified Streptomyces TaxID=2593676 RepID=UPI0037F2B183
MRRKVTNERQVSMLFRHPGYVSGFIQLRPEAEQDLAKLPKSSREEWAAAIEAAENDILHDTVELTREEHRGTYDPKWQSWKMPVELGIGVSAVEDGVATVRLVQRRIAGFETIYQVVSYLSGASIRHQVTVGEIVATGEKSRIRASLPQQKTTAAPGDAAYSFGAYVRLLVGLCYVSGQVVALVVSCWYEGERTRFVQGPVGGVRWGGVRAFVAC